MNSNMFRIVLLVLTFYSALSANATAQEADIIVINGEKWMLLYRPIVSDSVLRGKLLEVLPKERTTSTTNWDGFVAAWSIKDNRLNLDSILIETYDRNNHISVQKTLPKHKLEEFVKDVNNGSYVATWLSDTVRAGRGQCVFYMHDGYERYYETEQHLLVQKGRIVSSKRFENKVIVDGFSFSDIRTPEEIRQRFPIQINRHPEFKGTRIYFLIRYIKVDALGNFVDASVKSFTRNKSITDSQLQKVAQEFKDILAAIKPWKVVLLNGKVVPYDLYGRYLPYDFK